MMYLFLTIERKVVKREKPAYKASSTTASKQVTTSTKDGSSAQAPASDAKKLNSAHILFEKLLIEFFTMHYLSNCDIFQASDLPPKSPKKRKAIYGNPVFIKHDDDDNKDIPPTPFKTKKKNKKTKIFDDASYQPTKQNIEVEILPPPKKKNKPQPSGNIVLEHIGSNASNNDYLKV